MQQQQKGDSFSTFLRSVRQSEATQEGVNRVLAACGNEDSLRVEELRGSAKLSIVEFGQVLETMQQEGLVIVEGRPGAEIVRLTAAGKTTAGKTTAGKTAAQQGG